MVGVAILQSSVDPIERDFGVVGIFPDGDVIIRLVGALMLGTDDKRAVARRCMSLKARVRVADAGAVRQPALAA
jgi:hypothetical protein